jgi:hypothetical protein
LKPVIEENEDMCIVRIESDEGFLYDVYVVREIELKESERFNIAEVLEC